MSDVAKDRERLLPQATAIGEAWAHECASGLRASERGVVGAWPGTVREARNRVFVHLPSVRAQLAIDDELALTLARAAYEAARRSWQAISEPDLEP